ncbi:hypothetical protein AB2L27_18305 [Kineococcus sp. LSe6-4]|uniref:Universal stress protein n=1 Tax=Kineococcus halophytocola TaxID=3234027 RepID=A0ABV4H8F3_9ACTN
MPPQNLPPNASPSASPNTSPWTVVVLTEEAFGDVDAGNVARLHAAERAEGQDVRHLVLVPADTRRSLLADVVDKLSLGEVREAFADLGGDRPDSAEARAEAETALRATVEALRAEGLNAEGRTTGSDPLPAVRQALAEEPDARELVVVTRPHAVEDTFHTDWASRARDDLGVPVLHVYAGTTRLG